jgi:hypothetical protein
VLTEAPLAPFHFRSGTSAQPCQRSALLSSRGVSLTFGAWLSLIHSHRHDYWSKFGRAFLGITVHYVPPEDAAPLQRFYIRLIPAPESQTSRYTQQLFDEAMSVIPKSVFIAAMTTDNASNIKKFGIESSLRWIPCFAHTIQLFVRTAVDAISTKDKTLTKAQSLATLFRKSLSSARSLSHLCRTLSVTDRRTVVEVPTRWNTTLLMCRRLLELKVAMRNHF